MKNFDMAEVATLITPYYGLLRMVQEKGFEMTSAFREMFIDKQGIPMVMTPRSKGTLINNCIRAFIEKEIFGDPNARLVEMNGYHALLLFGKVLIRFNKMDENFNSSIQKRSGYRCFVNQGGEIEGFENEIIRIWAGFIPKDKQWSEIMRYFLVCFDAGQVIWYNNLDGTQSVEQLSIDITPPAPTRRTKVKGKEEREEKKTGTNE